MSCHKIWTTGYAGDDLDSFLKKTQQHNIEVIVDVRRNPVSRKKGFSKSRLAEFLKSHGIDYIHMRELGVPDELRQQLRDRACSLVEYFEGFCSYLATQRQALDELNALASQRRGCLICVESAPEECHRSVVADALAATAPAKWEIIHF